MPQSLPPDSWWDAVAQRYRPVIRLGSGGMATVWLAQDLRHDRQVAIKILAPHLSDELGRERFRREITILARLQHPHILPLIDSGEAEGQLWYATPYVAGESLRDLISRLGRLEIREVVRLGREIADALATAHREGIIHRDVKPENVLLSEGHALLADFGISRAPTVDKITLTGQSLGTPAYMSPEQVGGGKLDARTDLYSLGCVLFECLTGERPFDGPDVRTLIAKHALSPVPSIRALRPSVSEALEAVVRKCMEKLPADRWPTAAAVDQALEQSPTDSPTPASGPLRRRRQVTLLLGALLVGLILIGSALFRARPSVMPIVAASPLRQLTFRGNVRNPSISPDGRAVAYWAGGRVWIHDLDARTERSVGDSGATTGDLAWVADGSGILLWRSGRVNLLPRNGGSPRPYYQTSVGSDQVDANVFLFPNGMVKLSATHDSVTGKIVRGVFDVELFANQSHSRRVAADLTDDVSDIALSPAGDQILVVTETELVHIDLALGREVFRGSNRRPFLRKIGWLSDGRLIVLASDSGMSFLGRGPVTDLSNRRRWLRPLSSINDVASFSFSAQSKTLLVERSIHEGHLWWLDSQGRILEQLSSGTGRERWPAPSASGDTVYYQTMDGLRRITAPFGEPHAVPGDLGDAQETYLSPNGIRLLFYVPDSMGGVPQLLDLRTGAVQRFEILGTRGPVVGGHVASWLPSSEGFVTLVDEDSVVRIVLADIATGKGRVLAVESGHMFFNPVVSPDGREVVVHRFSTGLVALPLDATGSRRVIPARDSTLVLPLHWARNGWIYGRDLRSALQFQPDKLVRVHSASGEMERLGDSPVWCRDLVFVERRSRFICARDSDRSDLWIAEKVDLN